MKIGNFKHGVSTSKVELHSFNGEFFILKYLKTTNKYLREKSAYEKLENCPFVPKLLKRSVDDRILVIQYVGESLNIKYAPQDRKKFKPQIKELNQRLIKDYGIYHNDIRWKNVVESESGELFIIDFESWTPIKVGSRERDPEKILS
jgi:thiamine kinase-like enzyme